MFVCFQKIFEGQNIPPYMETGQSTVQQGGSWPDEVLYLSHCSNYKRLNWKKIAHLILSSIVQDLFEVSAVRPRPLHANLLAQKDLLLYTTTCILTYYVFSLTLILCILYSQILQTTLSSASSAECLVSKTRCCHRFCGRSEKVDEACRIMFPLSFLLFNVLYWWYYIYKT